MRYGGLALAPFDGLRVGLTGFRLSLFIMPLQLIPLGELVLVPLGSSPLHF